MRKSVRYSTQFHARKITRAEEKNLNMGFSTVLDSISEKIPRDEGDVDNNKELDAALHHMLEK